MKSISELEHEIRDFINSPRKRSDLIKDSAEWFKLCSSLDVIGDTEQAFDSYLKIDEPESDGEKYLNIYGVLQALFIQQDAVTHLSEALGLPYTVDPLITQIREIRNDSSGHPTKRGKGRAFNHISRISMERHSFKLMTTYPNADPKFTDVDVPKLIESQRSILQSTLSNVIDNLREEEMEHREKHRNKKLVDTFTSTGYYCEKIAEALGGGLPPEFGASLLKSMIDNIEEFKSELRNRGVLEAYEDSVGYYSNLLEYPLNELHNYFTNSSETKLNEKDAEIFLSFIRKNMDVMAQIANELDEEYEADV
ncbi:MAG: hypothetical protein KIS76_06530 [Pyrinomonadaceae bacterium]|nr:hypothetical protein [Pyrinomonadaceae bacterium]